ncbi:TPA: ABC transporter ATP-binding protein [Candidatus Sumerlaeota bacterium]|jgi:phospholipid/cholesterol/gamma-HCH transport system ATP-binding protein|nr:ABC transporter ATP-binding protein [Candidatus Sumerlaeota bacterium]
MHIQVQNLCKTFGANRVLDGVTLDFAPGKITVVLGGSGTGKSVLLKHLVGILQPDSGTVLVDGRDISQLKERELLPIRMRIGLLFQGGALLNSLNVEQNVGLGLREHGLYPEKEVRRIVQEKLTLMGLSDKGREMPANLSGGMRKRVALARTLTMNPEAILYDEPTAGLDPPRSGRVDALIREMSEKTKVTSVLVTHDMVSAFGLADYIYFLYRGKVIEAGTPDEFRQTKNEIVQRFINRDPAG